MKKCLKLFLWIVWHFMPLHEIYAQISFTANLPPSGLISRQQLWNISVVNASGQVYKVYLEWRMSDLESGVEIISARSNSIRISPGASAVSVQQLMPVQYNVLSPAYQSFGVTDLLPVGTFQICYSMWLQAGDRFDRISEDCQVTVVEPLSPPILTAPENGTLLPDPNPILTWIPPAPLNQFIDLTYDLVVVTVLPGQSDVDAIDRNIPFYARSSLSATAFPYSGGYPVFEPGKKYAWRVVARSTNRPVAYSEVWSFSLDTTEAIADLAVREGAYPRMSRTQQLSYAVMINDLRFEYLNPTADTTWNVQITELSGKRNWIRDFSMDTIPLHYGKNFVRIREELLPFLEDKKLYQLELRNSFGEVYRLRFEYHRRDP